MTIAEVPPTVADHDSVGPEQAAESEVRSYSRRVSTTFSRASNAIVTDADGTEYIDFLAGCSALNYGHNDPDMAAALADYVTSGGITHTMDLHTEARNSFLTAFQQKILGPRNMSYRVQFTGPTGTNAVEAAVKLARKVTQRTNVIAFTNGFHGVTSGALAMTGNQSHRMAPFVPLPGVTRALYDGYLGDEVDTAAALGQMLDDPSSGIDPPAAILLETVQAEGGLNVASTEWLEAISAIARKHGALLIIDDIQAGCGRTGSFFSFESADISPDIIVMSKSLSGFGLPFSIALIQPQIDNWSPGEHNGTFRGNNLAFITATVALNKFWSDSTLEERVLTVSNTVTSALELMAESVPNAYVKGKGLMLGVETHSGELADAIARTCFENGLILETAGARDSVVKLLPPLTIDDESLAEGLRILAKAFAHHA